MLANQGLLFAHAHHAAEIEGTRRGHEFEYQIPNVFWDQVSTNAWLPRPDAKAANSENPADSIYDDR